MQDVNKCAIGAVPAGDLQQENNYRTVGGPNLVSPPVRTGSVWPRQHSQISIATTSCQEEDNRRPAGRRVTYIPGNQARAFRAIRDDERDDALTGGRRDQMLEWNPRHAAARKESAFTTVPYHGDVQHRLPPRAAEQQQLTWRPIAESEWRRQLPSRVMREGRTPTGERIQVTMAAPAPLSRYDPHYETLYEPATTHTFQTSSSWSRGGFPTVAQVNSYNQQLRAEAERGYAEHRHIESRLNERSVAQHPGMHREGRAITLSSSNGSSTASAGTCRSPTGSHVGEKRVNESLTSPQAAVAAASYSPSSHYEPQHEPESAANRNSKRHKSSPSPRQPPKFDMLDLLCTATLEMGPLQENPSGCSCPKSKCIALYCDCFKAGRRCNPGTCTCLNCKNTIAESGANGARTVAIRTILARNPRAFTTAGVGNPPKDLSPGQVACNCIRSRCLKLYCGCFQAGKACDPKVCTCISCLNTEEDSTGARQSAIQQCLEKRPNAFQVKPREAGMGCACKNNRCVRKYCECFRNELACTEKCTCRECENPKGKV